MDNTHTLPAESAQRELEAELQTWDWARAAGVSADELRQVLQRLSPAATCAKPPSRA